jgi:hypothetical protein
VLTKESESVSKRKYCFVDGEACGSFQVRDWNTTPVKNKHSVDGERLTIFGFQAERPLGNSHRVDYTENLTYEFEVFLEKHHGHRKQEITLNISNPHRQQYGGEYHNLGC